MGEFLFSFPQLVFKMAISRNYGLLITTPVTTTTLTITICSPESTKQEQHVQPLTLSWEIHVALRHWPSKPHISSMKDLTSHGEPQALATEIWGTICPPSDQEAIV